MQAALTDADVQAYTGRVNGNKHQEAQMNSAVKILIVDDNPCLLYTSPSPRD